MTLSWSSTWRTPGAAHAAATAASRSYTEWTLPVSVTVPGDVATSRFLASTLALRSSAFLIECWTSCASGMDGISSISFSTATTPGTLPVTCTASSRWYWCSTAPSPVRHDLDIKLVVDLDDSPDPLGGFRRLTLLMKAADGAAKGHDAVLRRN